MSEIRERGLDRVMIAVIYVVLALLAVATLYPFVNIIAKAFSGFSANSQGRVFLLPVDFQLGTFKRVVLSGKYLGAAWVSARVTLAGTLLSITLSSFAAFALSHRRLRGRSFFTVLFVFTMMFSGGIVPGYMLMRALNLLNTIWVLFLPGAVSVYNMLVMKSSFEALPPSLEESAHIDGAGGFRTFFFIVVPVSLPTYAAVALFLSVGYWNSYTSAALYITKQAYKPLQMYLVDIIDYASDPLRSIDDTVMSVDSPSGVQSCAMLAATIPVLLVYPFLQKYFVKGIMLGSVKE